MSIVFKTDDPQGAVFGGGASSKVLKAAAVTALLTAPHLTNAEVCIAQHQQYLAKLQRVRNEGPMPPVPIVSCAPRVDEVALHANFEWEGYKYNEVFPCGEEVIQNYAELNDHTTAKDEFKPWGALNKKQVDTLLALRRDEYQEVRIITLVSGMQKRLDDAVQYAQKQKVPTFVYDATSGKLTVVRPGDPNNILTTVETIHQELHEILDKTRKDADSTSTIFLSVCIGVLACFKVIERIWPEWAKQNERDALQRKIRLLEARRAGI